MAVKTKIGDIKDILILSTTICIPYEFVYEKKPEEENNEPIDAHKNKILETLCDVLTNIDGIYRIEWDAGNMSGKYIDKTKVCYKNYIIVHRYVNKEELKVEG